MIIYGIRTTVPPIEITGDTISFKGNIVERDRSIVEVCFQSIREEYPTESYPRWYIDTDHCNASYDGFDMMYDLIRRYLYDYEVVFFHSTFIESVGIWRRFSDGFGFMERKKIVS